MQGSKLSGPDDGLYGLLKGLEDLNGTVPAGKAPQLRQSDDEAHSQDDDEEEQDLLLGNDSEDDEDEDALQGDDSGNEEKVVFGAGHGSDVEEDTEGDSSDEDDDEEAIDMQLEDESDDDEEAVDMQLEDETAAKPKYVPPAARNAKRQAPTVETKEVSQEERAAIQRKVRSLLNRVAVANLPRIASQLAEVFDSAPKPLVASCVTESIMQVRFSTHALCPHVQWPTAWSFMHWVATALSLCGAVFCGAVDVGDIL